MNFTPLAPARLDALPRVSLAAFPTPLQFLPRLSREMGHPIYIKRDDEIGPAMGGSKTRKLEYMMADAQKKRARKVATFGGLQSNHARLTAAVATRFGMEPHLFYFEKRPAQFEGNLLLNQLLGARLHFVPLGRGGDGSMTIEATIRLVHTVATLMIGPHYFVPVGGHSALGALGYVRAALELDAQARAQNMDKGCIVVAVGTGGTLAGLMAGLSVCDSRLRVLGLDVGRLWKNFPVSIARLANELCESLSYPRRFAASDVPLIESVYVGERYAAPTPAANAAIRTLARSEGIFLDPVYTGKAFAGMLDLIQQKKFAADEPLIFLHTGGAPALFAQ